ncbi:MAG: DNA methyltransferase, partial [bacterium]
MNLSDKEKDLIIEHIKNGEKLPKEYIYKMYEDEEDVFLFWNGRNEEVTNATLPFHSIEHIDEPRKEGKKEGDAFTMFDQKGRQLKGWTNKLIWGDNKLILSSLVNGPIREEIEKEGGLKLVYIDPPFAVGADFSHNININGENATKKQNILEEIAYRDTWGRGLSSYLSMMYERLKLMHQLLSDDGSIYVHIDWRVNNYLKIILDDIFGRNNFRNEIIWCYTGPGSPRMSQFNRKHDNILWYTKSTNWHFNDSLIRIPHDAKTTGNFKSGLRGSGFIADTYELKNGKIPEDWWEMAIAQRYPIDGIKRTGYTTEKPFPLMERIIKASSKENELIADFFSGS